MRKTRSVAQDGVRVCCKSFDIPKLSENELHTLKVSFTCLRLLQCLFAIYSRSTISAFFVKMSIIYKNWHNYWHNFRNIRALLALVTYYATSAITIFKSLPWDGSVLTSKTSNQRGKKCKEVGAWCRLILHHKNSGVSRLFTVSYFSLKSTACCNERPPWFQMSLLKKWAPCL